MEKTCVADSFTPQWIIVGLGNPGSEHKYNRHNAGFLCVDALANKLNIKIDKIKYHALVGFGEIGGQYCVLMKPNTYMNESGYAVDECARYYQIPPERVLVIFDDIAFAPGILRIRRQGSSGGHNGVNSITQHLCSKAFPRIKLGVGQKPYSDYELAEWVVSNMNEHELKALQEACERANQSVELIVHGEINEAILRYSH